MNKKELKQFLSNKDFTEAEKYLKSIAKPIGEDSSGGDIFDGPLYFYAINDTLLIIGVYCSDYDWGAQRELNGLVRMVKFDKLENLPNYETSDFMPYNENGGLYESKANKNMKKNVKKLNEATLRKVISESVKKALKEDNVNGINAGLVSNRRGRLTQVDVVENPTAYKIFRSEYLGDFRKRGFDPNLCGDTIYGRGFVFLANKPNSYHIKKYGDTVVTVKIDGEVPVYLSPADGEFIFIPAEEAGRIHQIGISRAHIGPRISEAKVRKIVSESVKKVLKEDFQPSETITNPVGYHFTNSNNLHSILSNGFDPSYIGRNGSILGPGFYFFTEYDSRLERVYGNAVLKVMVKGTFSSYNTNGVNVFVVPPEEANNIQIIEYSDSNDFKTERVFHKV